MDGAPAANSIRERGKEDRRRRILDTAEALVRESASTDFTIAQLAERAVLSVPTPYNLFGSKAGLLYALLNRSLDPIMARADEVRGAKDPIARVFAAAQSAIDVFVGDPDFYRPLYQFLLGVGDAVHRPVFLERSRHYWLRTLTPLTASGQLGSARTGEQLARSCVLNFMAALDLWVHAELDHEQFRAQILHGIALLLLGFATAQQRPGLLRRLRELQRRLPGGFRPAPERASTSRRETRRKCAAYPDTP